jgi:FG-GAP-like repeat
MGTVSPVRVLSTCVFALALLVAGLAGPAAAWAGFVPALGSPFSYEAPNQALAVGDGDRNGTVDVVAGGLTLRRGAGTGFLGSPILVGPTGPVEGLASADLDGDGLFDYAAIVPGSSPGAPRQLRRYVAVAGNGFTAETVLPDAGEATDVAVADLNGDTLADLVVVRDDDADSDQPGRQDVTVIPGGALRLNESYESGLGSPRDVELADLGSDGRPEIVVAGTEASISVLTNDGVGRFADGDLAPTGAVGATRRIALTELNGDGRADVLAANSGAPTVLALLGSGSGGFQPLGPRATGMPGALESITAGDVNGDGVADAVAGGDASFAVLIGDGRGGLNPAAGSPFPTWTAAGDPVEDVVVADMNRDGQADVVTANRNGSVSVQLNADTGLLTAAPTGVDFGTLLPATGIQTRTITLRSERGRLRLTRLDRQGSPVFSVRDVDCLDRTLPVGQTCSLTVSFNAPRRARRYEALLSVDANAAALVVPLTATTRPPIVAGPRLKRKRVKSGQRLDLRYRLSEGALTQVVTERALPGRRVGTRCVAPRRGNLKRRRCALWDEVATAARRDLAGRQRMKIATRAKPSGAGRKRRLGPAYPAGAYRLEVTALDRFRNRSAEQYVRFEVVAPKVRRPKAPRKRG